MLRNPTTFMARHPSLMVASSSPSDAARRSAIKRNARRHDRHMLSAETRQKAAEAMQQLAQARAV